MKFLFTSLLLLCLFTANTQSLSFKAGGNFNRTIRSSYPGIQGFTFENFSPKNGYQTGLTYKHTVHKSFFIDAEIGFLNKGHVRKAPSRTSTVDYNYLTFTPSIGYNLPFGFSLKVGLGINYLLNTKGYILSIFNGTIDKTEYALTTVLAYNYKRFGLELSHSNNIKTMERFEFSGIKYENYHEWYAASLSFQIFKKQPKTP